MSDIAPPNLMDAMHAGLAKAAALGEPSSIAICDSGGNLLGFVRSMESAFGTVEIAIAKAYTAAAFRMTTADLSADSQPGGEFYGLNSASAGRPFVVFAGGIPIFEGSQCIGAVGVSGGPVAVDVEIAETVAGALRS